ncbi:MAG: hypothetical protein K1X67_20440 [Fimbriimonadaceae bacterium]|nr:hypothetical protein [Fimbriimonadaceae bacterium]
MNSSLSSLRLRKRELYAIAGAIGGAIGASVAELALILDTNRSTRIGGIVGTGLWSAAFASVLGSALFLASEWHQRREFSSDRWAKVFSLGAIAGFLSGAGAQYLYSLEIGSFELRNYGLRILAWAIMGALLGAMLSRSVPNLGLIRGTSAGVLGGAIGCMGFLLTSMFLPGFAGRVVGIALLGLALGLAMYFVQNMFQEASLEVEWAPNESTRVGLGAQPVVIGGGGEEHIFKKGLPPCVSSIVLKDGLIEHVETSNGKRTPLQDGSRLRIGGLNMVVHAVSGAGGSAPNKRRDLIVATSVACAVLIGAVAITVTARGHTLGASSAQGPGKITTLESVGDSAKLDTSSPITEVKVRLEWKAAVDLDLSAYYTTKAGDTGAVDYTYKSGPNMHLDNDAGVGDLGGQNEENISITSLDNYKEIWFATKIFSKGGSYSDYDGRVTVQTNNGDVIQVPLTSKEVKPYLVIAKLTNGQDGPTITNLNDAVDCEELTKVLGRGNCVPIQPKQGVPR